MRISILLMFVIISACNNKSNPGIDTKPIAIQLADSLGKTSFNVPNRYDTSFTWTALNDCGKSCEEIKYRYQSKRLRAIKEGGFIWLNEPIDSIDRFTISHSGYFPFYVGNKEKIEGMHRRTIYNITNDIYHPARLVFDTLRQVNGRLFSIAVADSFNTATNLRIKKVIAVTTIKTNTINFLFELVTKKADTVNFIQNALECIKSIKIEKDI